MTEEQLKYEGKLGMAKEELRDYRLRAQRLVREMRNDLDPTVEPEKLPVDRILQQADELATLCNTELKICIEHIAQYRELAGRR